MGNHLESSTSAVRRDGEGSKAAARPSKTKTKTRRRGSFGLHKSIYSLVVASLEQARIGGIWNVERHCGKTVRLKKAHTRARVERLWW